MNFNSDNLPDLGQLGQEEIRFRCPVMDCENTFPAQMDLAGSLNFHSHLLLHILINQGIGRPGLVKEVIDVEVPPQDGN